MLNIIISILSDQPVPNLLFIKQMGKPGDKHIFISTEKMEEAHKSTILAETLKLGKNDYTIIRIDHSNAALILEKLDAVTWPMAENYLINITGGTKMMSQMVFEVFKDFENAAIYYWPYSNAHLQELHPYIIQHKIEHPVLLDLETYFSIHGYEITASGKPEYSFEKADSIYKECIKKGRAELVEQIVTAKEQNYPHPDKGYWCGTWFEEWLYYQFNKRYNLADNAISMNIKIKHRYSERAGESDIELDVAYMLQNNLFVWEAKVFNNEKGVARNLPEIIHKITSISQTLGISTKRFLAIMGPMYDERMLRKQFIDDIARLLKIDGIYGLEDFASDKVFS